MTRWSSRDAANEPDGLILFDGVCVFCSRWVRFVMDHDAEKRFSFVAIQSETGRALAIRYGIDPEAPQTNAVIMDGRIHFKSEAALTVLKAMPATAWLGRLRIVPTVLRDPIYDVVAQNRYRIFGRSDACMVPSADERSRFLT